MQVTLLGPVAAEVDGRQLPLGGRKQRAVFALLALNPNRTVSLDRLVYEIWHDEPPARATLSLQAYISRLRGVLADGAPDSRAQIVTRAPGWMLRISAQQIDASRFATFVADARALLAAGNVGEAAVLLEEALALWCGEPLGGPAEAGFAVTDVERLQEQRLEATELCYEAGLQAGEAPAIVAAARAFVAEHPYRERAWCSLILALYRSGRQADALAAVRELRQTLAEGLGLDPSPEAQDLEDRILRHDPGLAHPLAAASDGRGMGTPAAHGSASDRRPEDAVVGRVAELDAVVAAVTSAKGGSGRLLVVDGPAGMGKSTILRRLENSVHAVGGLVLRAGGVGAGAMPALWPWVTIVRQLIDLIPDLNRSGRDGAAVRVLALLDPSFGDGVATGSPADAADAADAALIRTRLYRAVLDLLAAARADRMFAIVLDDVHWLDRETLDLLALAVDDLLVRGVLFAVALRPDESSEVRRTVEALGSGAPDNVMKLALTGLDVDSVRLIVRRVADVEPAAEVVDAICSRTAGNPFFVLEFVRLLVSERRFDREGVYALLPAGIREVLRRRLDRLPEQTLAVLGVIALMGRPVDVDLLARVTAMSEDRVLDACEAAVLAGLLVDEPLTGGFALCHDLVRQTLDQALSAARRVRLHARIGSALRGGGEALAPERVVEIAHHLTLAAPVSGAAAAVPYLLMAADDVLLASNKFTEFLSTAQQLVDQIPEPAVRQRCAEEIRARVIAGRILGRGRAVDSGADVVAGTFEPGPVVPLDPDAPAAWWSGVAVLIASGDNAGAARAAQSVLSDDLPSGAAAAVYFIRGLARLELGELDGALEDLVRTERLARGTQEGPARGLLNFAGISIALQAVVATLCGDRATAAALRRAAEEMPIESEMQAVSVPFWGSWCMVLEGDVDGAARLAVLCAERAVQLGPMFYTPSCALILGWCAAMRGDASGLERAATAQQDCLALGVRHQVTTQLMMRAEAHAHHGELDTARELILEARALGGCYGRAHARAAPDRHWQSQLVPTSEDAGTS